MTVIDDIMTHVHAETGYTFSEHDFKKPFSWREASGVVHAVSAPAETSTLHLHFAGTRAGLHAVLAALATGKTRWEWTGRVLDGNLGWVGDGTFGTEWATGVDATLSLTPRTIATGDTITFTKDGDARMKVGGLPIGDVDDFSNLAVGTKMRTVATWIGRWNTWVERADCAWTTVLLAGRRWGYMNVSSTSGNISPRLIYTTMGTSGTGLIINRISWVMKPTRLSAYLGPIMNFNVCYVGLRVVDGVYQIVYHDNTTEVAVPGLYTLGDEITFIVSRPALEHQHDLSISVNGGTPTVITNINNYYLWLWNDLMQCDVISGTDNASIPQCYVTDIDPSWILPSDNELVFGAGDTYSLNGGTAVAHTETAVEDIDFVGKFKDIGFSWTDYKYFDPVAGHVAALSDPHHTGLGAMGNPPTNRYIIELVIKT